MALALAPNRRDLLGQPRVPGAGAAAGARPILVGVALVQALQVPGQLLVRLPDERAQRGPREVAVLVVDRLDARAVHRQELAAEQVEPSAQDHELPEHGPEGGAVVASEVGDGLEVRLQAPDEPDHLDVAVRLGLQAPAGSHPVEVAVDVELQQVGRVVARPARGLRDDAGEAGPCEVQLVDEGLDEADRVVRADVVVHRLRQEQELRAVMSREMRHGRAYHGNPLTRQNNQPGSHTVCLIYVVGSTQPAVAGAGSPRLPRARPAPAPIAPEG